MKKVLSIILAIGLIMSFSMATALADDPPYSGNVHGVITVNGATITGTLEGDYDLTFNGQGTGQVGQVSSFMGTFTGDIASSTNGVAGKLNENGNDSLFAEISGTGASGHVYLLGGFPPCGINNYFEGKIITTVDPIVGISAADIVVSTTEGVFSAPVGGTLHLQMDAPSGYEVRWGVYANDRDAGYASVDADGTLHILAMPTDGNILVMANTLEPNVSSKNITITVTNPETEVKASIDPTYTIVIPAAVNFGTLMKSNVDNTFAVQDFDVTATGVLIEDNASIDVKVQSDFTMKDAANTPLGYTLSNGVVLSNNGIFASFTADAVQDGEVAVDTYDITNAGAYSGVMTFLISYELS